MEKNGRPQERGWGYEKEDEKRKRKEKNVHEPLEGGEGADHGDAHGQAVPQAAEADVAVDARDGLASALARYRSRISQSVVVRIRKNIVFGGRVGQEQPKLTFSVTVQLADHHIGRMADHRTGNAGNVPTRKAHAGLRQLAVALLGLAQPAVNEADRLLKRGKLAHGVRNLASPQGHDALVQARHPFLGDDLAPPFPQRVRKGRQGGLHAHLDRLKGAQQHVGEELGGRARGEEHDRPVGGGREQVVAVLVLEDLVEAVFPQALERVADEGG